MAKRIFKALGTLLLVIVLAAVGLLAFLTITEFRTAGKWSGLPRRRA